MDSNKHQSIEKMRWNFSTDDLPADAGDRQRRDAWRDYWASIPKIQFDIIESNDGTFYGHEEVAILDDLALCTGRSAATRITRTKQHTAADEAGYFLLHLNEGPQLQGAETPRGIWELEHGMLGLSSSLDAADYYRTPDALSRNIVVSSEAIGKLIRNPDDLAPSILDPTRPATQLLKNYMQLLFTTDSLETDETVSTHVSQTFHDLLALAIGASREAAELSTLRGARAAKLQLILAGIKFGFQDPGFSEHRLAQKFGIAPRTIRDLLMQTGTTFSERVLELRLQRARKMLIDPKCKHMRVGDIALASGFNEVPYFNRRFRQRFGATPTNVRP